MQSHSDWQPDTAAAQINSKAIPNSLLAITLPWFIGHTAPIVDAMYSLARLHVDIGGTLRVYQARWRRTQTDAQIIAQRRLPAIGPGRGDARTLALDVP